MNYKIEISETELNQVMVYLQEKPYREVAQLIGKIGLQAQEQQQLKAQAKEPTQVEPPQTKKQG